MNVCTIIARNYLAYARVLAASFQEHHSGSTCSVLVIDDMEGAVDASGEPFELVRPADIDLPEFERMAGTYDILELSTAVKPWLLRWMLRERNDSGVAYLDPDIQVFGRMAEVEAILRTHSLVLTPHVTGPMPRDGRKPSETDILVAGVYNLGFIGVSDTAQTQALLDWWSERLLSDCRVAPEHGLFVDQRWVDFVPGMVSDMVVLRDPAYNVAYWNLPERRLEAVDGGYEANGAPLRFFHFSGYSPDDRTRLSKHQDRIDLGENPAVEAICEAYGDALEAAGHDHVKGLPYAFGRLPSGVPLDRLMRNIYREGLEANALAEPLFTPAGESDFLAYLSEPDPDAPRISRYLRHVWMSRPDVRSTYPDLAGADAEGFLGWCEAFGREQVPIPAVLLPGGAAATAASRNAQPAVPRPFGVNVAGYLRSELGIGEVARQVISALDAVGVPALPVGLHAPLSRQGHDFAAGGHVENPLPVNLVCVNADGLPSFAEQAGEQFFEGRHTVGFWWWELSAFPSRFEAAFEHVDEVWVGSRFVADALSEAAPVPVVRIPVPVEIPHDLPLAPGELGWPEGYTFLFSWDYNSVFERKNPLAVVGAFTEAFAPGDGPTLVLKCINHEADAGNHARLQRAIADRDDILLMDRYVDARDKNRIMRSGDCYVSLHRSEGFGLTMAEAMYAGRPVIATAYSGNLEFMDERNSYLVGHALVPVGPGAGPYPPEAIWAEPDVHHAARLMRAVFEDREEAARRGARAAADIRSLHSARASGTAMERRLERIETRLNGQPPVTALSEWVGREDRDTAELVHRGPDGGRARHGARSVVRRGLLRGMRPFTAYQQQVNAGLVAAQQETVLRTAEAISAFEAQAAVAHATTLAELRRQRAILEHQSAAIAAERVENKRWRADEEARWRSGPLVSRFPPPAVPWTHEYITVHRAFVTAMLADPSVIAAFAAGYELPPFYGVGLDERVIEYPWLAAQEPAGRTLDAGSVLNHDHILEWFRPRLDALTIATLEPEEHDFPERRIDYVYADLRKLPFNDAEFDTVVCVSTLDHVGMDNRMYGSDLPRAEDPQAEAGRAMAEMARVVVPGGRVLLTVPYGQPEDLGWMRQFDRTAFEGLLDGHGLAVERVDVFRYRPGGWERADLDAAGAERYRDYTRDPSPVDDHAAAARAVACAVLRRPPADGPRP